MYSVKGFSSTNIYIYLTRRFIPLVATALIAISNECGISQFGRAYQKRGIYIPTPAANAQPFDSEVRKKVQEELGIKNEFTILQVGSLQKKKNQEFSLSILKELKDGYKLLLVGGGDDLPKLKARAKELGIEKDVSFLGSLENITELFFAADLLVMPSLYEGFGIVAVVAAASGILAVVSDKVPPEVGYTKRIVYKSLRVSEFVNEIQNARSAWQKLSEEELNKIRLNDWQEFLKSEHSEEKSAEILVKVYKID